MIKEKRGQVTVFIIVAVLIVVAGVAVYQFYPKIKSTFSSETENPESFIETCIEDDFENIVESISNQGGSLEPEHYSMYDGDKVEYLCYTNKNYEECVVQQPMLKQHAEKEIKDNIEDKVGACFNDLKSSYTEKGYQVDMKEGESKVELLPGKVVLTPNYDVTLTKDSSEKYEKFSIVLNNNLYELISIANSIIEWETTYGDSDPAIYMTYYSDLKVEKIIQQDSTKIYILTNRDDENKFQFASRSVVYPAGFGLENA